jgi:hypothetical protein
MFYIKYKGEEEIKQAFQMMILDQEVNQPKEVQDGEVVM